MCRILLSTSLYNSAIIKLYNLKIIIRLRVNFEKFNDLYVLATPCFHTIKYDSNYQSGANAFKPI